MSGDEVPVAVWRDQGFAHGLTMEVPEVVRAVRFASGDLLGKAGLADCIKADRKIYLVDECATVRAVGSGDGRGGLLPVHIPGGVLLEAASVFSSFRLNVDSAYAKVVSFAALPPNLKPVSEASVQDVLDYQGVLAFLFKDWGIPLYLVPRLDVAKWLLAAGSYKECQEILVESEDAIVEDCLAVLEPGLVGSVDVTVSSLMEEGVSVLQAGRYAAAQVLFTAVLDTLIRKWFSSRERRFMTDSRKGATGGCLQVYWLNVVNLVAFIPVQSAHRFFDSSRRGEDWVYNRHRTIHAGDLMQYTHPSAIQALMLATSVAGFDARRYCPMIRDALNAIQGSSFPPASVLLYGARDPQVYVLETMTHLREHPFPPRPLSQDLIVRAKHKRV